MWSIAVLIALAQGEAPALPEWMSGCWEELSAGRETVECWSLPTGNVMNGEGVSRAGQKSVERETMEIVHETTDDPSIPRITYWATPANGARTAFRWVPSSEPGLTFVNTEHDYPQRIRYWREGYFLMAETALADGSKAKRWRYSARGR